MGILWGMSGVLWDISMVLWDTSMVLWETLGVLFGMMGCNTFPPPEAVIKCDHLEDPPSPRQVIAGYLNGPFMIFIPCQVVRKQNTQDFPIISEKTNLNLLYLI